MKKTRIFHSAKIPSNDIVRLIFNDHKPIKKLINILKSDRVEYSRKKSVLKEFVPLLMAHAKPEEESLYSFFKANNFRVEGFEGETEHAIAALVIKELEYIEDQDEWLAKVKVLAESVSAHIKEEETEVLPTFKRKSTVEQRTLLGEDYLRLRSDFLVNASSDETSLNKLISLFGIEVPTSA